MLAGKPAGPFRALLVADQLERGTLGEQPIVWREGWSEWRPLAEVPPFADAFERWQRRRDATAVLPIEDVDFDSDPAAASPRKSTATPSTETWPLAAVEFVAEPFDVEDEKTPPRSRAHATVPTPGPRTFGRVSRRIAPRPEVTGVYSLEALQMQAGRSPSMPAPELPAFPPTALASVALPLEPAVAAAPVEPIPIAFTPPPKSAPHFGMYVMLFVLMAAMAGLVVLVIVRDGEPIVVADTSDRGELSHAAMSRKPEVASEPAPDPDRDCDRDPSKCPKRVPIRIAVVPDKPSSAELEAALAAVRPVAKKCGLLHAAAEGTKVELELSIAGKGGRVISAIPKPPHDDDALGECVADALRGAAFPTFRQPSLSLRYAVTM